MPPPLTIVCLLLGVQACASDPAVRGDPGLDRLRSAFADPLRGHLLWSVYGFPDTVDTFDFVALVGDVDGDGLADAAMGGPGGVWLCRGSNRGLDRATQRLGIPERDAQVAGLGDVNDDGFADVAVRMSDTDLVIWLGGEDGLVESITLSLPDLGATPMAFGAAGDVDADGFDDVILGSDGASEAPGAAWIYRGSRDGLETSPATTLAFAFSEEDDAFGASVAGAGDIDGDGFDDVVVGVPDRALAMVFLGSREGVDASRAVALLGPPGFGYTVAGVGDVNGDGFDDVLAGSDGADAEPVGLSLFLGSPSGVQPEVAQSWTAGVAASAGAIHGAGDVDGDGHDDVVIGAAEVSDGAGEADLYLGSPTGLNFAASFRGNSDAYLGSAVAGGGDLDGDGYDDVLLAAPGAEDGSGEAWVWAGGTGGRGPLAAIEGHDATWLGGHVAGLGDIDGDGFPDVSVAIGGDDGGAAVYLGRRGGFGEEPTLLLPGFGGNIHGPGDTNGDGLDDVLVGSTWYPGATGGVGPAIVLRDTGDGAPTGDLDGDGFADVVAFGADAVEVTVAYGAVSGPGTSRTGQLTAPAAGVVPVCAGDLDGDGFDDLAMGYGIPLSGRVLADHVAVYPGSPEGVDDADRTILNPPIDPDDADGFGWTLAGAGDLDGDGYDDLVVGAFAAFRAGWQGSGAAWLYLGAATGLASAPPFAFEPGEDDGELGSAFAAPGDLDGDGYDDLVVGVRHGSLGVAAVYPGSAAGPSARAYSFHGPTESGLTLWQGGLDVAGDVDGDGTLDLIAGDYGDNYDAGAAFVLSGAPAGDW